VFKWLTRWSNNGLLWTRKWTLCVADRRGISGLKYIVHFPHRFSSFCHRRFLSSTCHTAGKDNFPILMDPQVLPLAREGEILNYLWPGYWLERNLHSVACRARIEPRDLLYWHAQYLHASEIATADWQPQFETHKRLWRSTLSSEVRISGVQTGVQPGSDWRPGVVCYVWETWSKGRK
jgi:hypothetical protein